MKLKTNSLLRLPCLVLAAVVTLCAFGPPEAAAQNYRLLTIPNPWATVSAGVSSNTVSMTNNGGYAAPAFLTLPKVPKYGVDFMPTFTCPTVTLASVRFVIQPSIDGTNFGNVQGGQNLLDYTIPAGTASGNLTNVAGYTNWTAATLGNKRYLRIGAIGNGNAAALSSINLTIGYWDID